MVFKSALTNGSAALGVLDMVRQSMPFLRSEPNPATITDCDGNEKELVPVRSSRSRPIVGDTRQNSLIKYGSEKSHRVL